MRHEESHESHESHEVSTSSWQGGAEEEAAAELAADLAEDQAASAFTAFLFVLLQGSSSFEIPRGALKKR